MATTLKRIASSLIGAASTTIGSYTIPVGATAAVKGLSLASRTGTMAVINVELWNAGAKVCTIIEGAQIPPGDALIVIGAEQTVFLQAGDQIRVQATTGSVDALLCFAEIAP